MSEKLRSARLVLNTGHFFGVTTGGVYVPYNTNSVVVPGDPNTALGTADSARLNCTYINLDWLMILGELYDKYSTFSLVLESVNYLSNGGTAYGTPYGVMNVVATGLDWLDQTYDVTTKIKGTGCIIYSGSVYNTITPQIEGIIFRKPTTRYGNLKLKLMQATTNTLLTGGDRPCAHCYVFKIFGVEKIYGLDRITQSG